MKNLLRFFIALTLLNSCENDNYAAPELTVTGKIIDSKTNALVESGGSNGGSIVKFYQNNSTQALLYKTMPDGTFINSRVFAGNYRYVAEGPFQVMLDTPSIAINANMQMEIKVVPNRLNAGTILGAPVRLGRGTRGARRGEPFRHILGASTCACSSRANLGPAPTFAGWSQV